METVLVAMFEDIHEQSPPAKGTDKPTALELSLAPRMGQAQGQALDQQDTTPTGAGARQSQGMATQGEDEVLNEPLTSATDLTARLTAEQQEEKLRTAREAQSDVAAELAASSVTSLLSSISLGHVEVFGMVREYLNGLAESPLGETFLNWTKRGLARVSPREPPTAAQTVEPDAQALQDAADTQLSQEITSTGASSDADLAQMKAQKEPPLQGAVDLAKQTVDLQQHNAACPSCGHPDDPDEPDEPEPELVPGE